MYNKIHKVEFDKELYSKKYYKIVREFYGKRILIFENLEKEMAEKISNELDRAFNYGCEISY